MKEDSKIRLSSHELNVIGERDLFFTKKMITEKIYQQLAMLIEETKAQKIYDGIIFPAGTDFITGKISKGENYLGLPFIMLDFPKFFSGENILAARTMIWWGNFCSNTFLLSGEPLEEHRSGINKNFSLLKENNFSVCVSDSPWHHHFEKENFIPVKKLDRSSWENIATEKSFLKVGRKIPINQINRLIPFSILSYKTFAELLKRKT